MVAKIYDGLKKWSENMLTSKIHEIAKTISYNKKIMTKFKQAYSSATK